MLVKEQLIKKFPITRFNYAFLIPEKFSRFSELTLPGKAGSDGMGLALLSSESRTGLPAERKKRDQKP